MKSEQSQIKLLENKCLHLSFLSIYNVLPHHCYHWVRSHCFYHICKSCLYIFQRHTGTLLVDTPCMYNRFLHHHHLDSQPCHHTTMTWVSIAPVLSSMMYGEDTKLKGFKNLKFPCQQDTVKNL